MGDFGSYMANVADSWERRAQRAEAEIAVLRAEIGKLKDELTEWHECARYDPTMEGPRFKGWDRIQMERCRKTYLK